MKRRQIAPFVYSGREVPNNGWSQPQPAQFVPAIKSDDEVRKDLEQLLDSLGSYVNKMDRFGQGQSIQTRPTQSQPQVNFRVGCKYLYYRYQPGGRQVFYSWHNSCVWEIGPSGYPELTADQAPADHWNNNHGIYAVASPKDRELNLMLETMYPLIRQLYDGVQLVWVLLSGTVIEGDERGYRAERAAIIRPVLSTEERVCYIGKTVQIIHGNVVKFTVTEGEPVQQPAKAPAVSAPRTAPRPQPLPAPAPVKPQPASVPVCTGDDPEDFKLPYAPKVMYSGFKHKRPGVLLDSEWAALFKGSERK